MEQRHKDWLINSLRYFRAIDFFSSDSSLSDEDLMQRIVAGERAAFRENGRKPFWERPNESQDFLAQDRPPSGEDWLDELYARMDRPRPDYKDLLLLAYDTSRLWWHDSEGDIAPGYDEYARTVKEWSRISRSAFLPTNIREDWDQPERWPNCQVVIQFLLEGREYTLEPWRGYGWLDFGLLNGINPLISGSGFAYEMWDTNDQTSCLLVLTAEEKRRLKGERGWEFLDVNALGYGFRDF